MIGEITQADTLVRPRLVVRDRTGASFVVALYLDRAINASRILSRFKKGYTVAIMTALGHYFQDGTAGCRIEEEDEITVSVEAPFLHLSEALAKVAMLSLKREIQPGADWNPDLPMQAR